MFRVGRRRFAIFNGACRRRGDVGARRVARFTFWPIRKRSFHYAKTDGSGPRRTLEMSLEDHVAVDWSEIAERLESGYLQVSDRA